MAKQYWLMKSEPNVFSIDDLSKSPRKTTHWDGVRNYQARNFMRDQMQVGDEVLFYHSNINPSIVGTAEVVKAGYPDHTAQDKKSKYHDAKATADKPIWYMVDIKFTSKFAKPLPLPDLREVTALGEMKLLKKGMRLSVQPVTAEEYRKVLSLARKGA